MGNMIKVGMADMNYCHAPDAITTVGLGSCVGVVLYDANAKIAGLVHIMLPDSTKIKIHQHLQAPPSFYYSQVPQVVF